MTAGSPVDTAFTGSVAELYERYLVPLIFEPYALDVAMRVAAKKPRHVLELAAGTGVVTRQLSVMLDEAAEIVATDLNPAMLREAERIGTARPVQWKAADAMQLPFGDRSFDAVVCQFGAMFFPDRPRAYAETRRVLRPGGVFAFNIWAGIDVNEFADAATAALATLYPQDPPRFMARTPHGHGDARQIVSDLAAAGFTAPPEVERIAFTSRAVSAHIVAVAYCQGTPLRGEIESRDPGGLERATRVAEEEMVRRFGSGPVEGRIEALVVTVAA